MLTKPFIRSLIHHQSSSRIQLHCVGALAYRPSGARQQSSNVTPSAADRRLAGRKRFYKNVGIAATSPPDETKAKMVNGSTADNESVASPISAGVDGTQSATGVHTSIKRASSWSSLLNPHNKPPKNGWHTVTLDGRPLRTPLGVPLTLPSIPLALAVASEWDAQKEYLRPAQMPLMTLCCTAIDQVASDPNPHRIDILRYLRNDTSCYWADPGEDRVLHRKQSQAWDGLHKSISRDMLGLPNDLDPAQAFGGDEAFLLSRRSEGNPVSGLPHPPILVERAQKFVDGLDAWNLAALYSACAESKSFFIGSALIFEAKQRYECNGSNRDAKWAVTASRIEEEFNIEAWGLVEGGHDYDRLNSSIQMHSASFLVQTIAQSVYLE
jgi:ATP synthase F1 complex assembly factor 2